MWIGLHIGLQMIRSDTIPTFIGERYYPQRENKEKNDPLLFLLGGEEGRIVFIEGISIMGNSPQMWQRRNHLRVSL